MGINNNDRATRAGEALDAYIGGDSLSPDDALSDLLCDLRHWADSRGEGFIECDNIGKANYLVELKEETAK